MFVKACLLAAFGLLAIGADAVELINQSASPPAGTYLRGRATGMLVIERSSLATSRFSIDSTGANAHSCSVSGTLADGVGRTIQTTGSDEPVCSIAFERKGAAWSVRAVTEDACRWFCGARANFDGDYGPLPAGCAASELKTERATFDRQYKAGDYGTALATLDAMRTRCATALTWIETDRIRNDIAITQHHLGLNAACLSTLKPTFAAGIADSDALEAALPPADFYAYVAVARSTWLNQSLCRKGGR